MSDADGDAVDDLAELREYLGPRFDESKLENWEQGVEAELAEVGDESELYRSSEAYLYNLAVFAISGIKHPYLEALERVVPPGAGSSTTGAASAPTALRLLERGFDVAFADFDNPSTRFLRWRLERRGCDAPVYDLDRDPIPPGFDAAFAFDVIEHVDDPLAMLERMEARRRDRCRQPARVAPRRGGERAAPRRCRSGSSSPERAARRAVPLREAPRPLAPRPLRPRRGAEASRVAAARPAANRRARLDGPRGATALPRRYPAAAVTVEGPKISVVVSGRDAESTIERAVRAMLDQRGAPPHEVVVVDNASQDRTGALAEQAGARVIRLDDRAAGPGTARNAGVEAARGELVAFTDADCFPSEAWLAALARGFDRADIVSGPVLPDPQAVPLPLGPHDRAFTRRARSSPRRTWASAATHSSRPVGFATGTPTTSRPPRILTARTPPSPGG